MHANIAWIIVACGEGVQGSPGWLQVAMRHDHGANIADYGASV
jgi:hypothetical protein